MKRELKFPIDSILRLMAERPNPTLVLSWACLISMISGLQLALRHPEWAGAGRATVRDLVDQFMLELDRVAPDVGVFMRLGDDPHFDGFTNSDFRI